MNQPVEERKKRKSSNKMKKKPRTSIKAHFNGRQTRGVHRRGHRIRVSTSVSLTKKEEEWGEVGG